MHTSTVLLYFNASLTTGVQSLLVKINYSRLLLESFLGGGGGEIFQSVKFL